MNEGQIEIDEDFAIAARYDRRARIDALCVDRSSLYAYGHGWPLPPWSPEGRRREQAIARRFGPRSEVTWSERLEAWRAFARGPGRAS